MGFIRRIKTALSKSAPDFANINIDVSNLDVGRSGDAGTLDIFSATALKGKTTYQATANASNLATLIIDNVAQDGNATFKWPDVVGSAGIVVNKPGGACHQITTPATATATATLTAAQMAAGILVATPAAAVTYTTLTGTLLEAEHSAAIANDDAFDLFIINLGGAGDIITLAGGTGVTIVGSATVDDAGADISSTGWFRFRRTAANTWVAYRMN